MNKGHGNEEVSDDGTSEWANGSRWSILYFYSLLLGSVACLGLLLAVVRKAESGLGTCHYVRVHGLTADLDQPPDVCEVD
jgi:hypothetical protein